MNFVFDEETHTYKIGDRKIPSVTEILVSEGFIDTTWYQEYGRDRGKKVHKATHLYDAGELDEEELDPVLRPYLDAWIKFKADTRFEIYECEIPSVDQFYRYAGTPDRIGLFDKSITVLDIKTGAVEPWVRLQLVAYGQMKGAYGRIAVQLNDDGTYRLHQFLDRQDKSIWDAVLATHWWKRNNLKGR